jgi:hypothetical protein
MIVSSSAVGNPSTERILRGGSHITDMDAAVIKVEVECLSFAFSEGERCGSCQGLILASRRTLGGFATSLGARRHEDQNFDLERFVPKCIAPLAPISATNALGCCNCGCKASPQSLNLIISPEVRTAWDQTPTSLLIFCKIATTTKP